MKESECVGAYELLYHMNGERYYSIRESEMMNRPERDEERENVKNVVVCFCVGSTSDYSL